MPKNHHVSLRPLRIADASVIAAWASDPLFCQEADWTADLPVEEHVRFWKGLIEQPAEDLLRLGAVQFAYSSVSACRKQGAEVTLHS